MNRPYSIVSLLWLASLTPAIAGNTIIIGNNLQDNRKNEIVEVSSELLKDCELFLNRDENPFLILDEAGKEVPYQVTSDGTLIFPATVGSKSTAVYTLKQGAPAHVDTYCCGRVYPERLDDMTWENDKCAYRAYGPALEKSGQKAYGYDIWCKSVSHPVVEERYFKHLKRNMSFHKNHGDGMDVFNVGPTLGAGTAAIIDTQGQITYPWGYEKAEVIDNGPLRFKMRLTYPVKVVDGDSIVETRTLSLDKGDWLNKTTVEYSGATKPLRILQGIVLHKESVGDFTVDKEEKYASVVDFTDNPDGDNGEIYIGIVSPSSEVFDFFPLPQPEGDALGHVGAIALCEVGKPITYWWGSGWSSGGVYDAEYWNELLSAKSRQINSPLTVEVK